MGQDTRKDGMFEASLAVECLVSALYGAREAKRGKIDAAAVTPWGRMLAEAVQAEARANDGYSPEEDRRVLWAREVIAAAGRNEAMSRASGELEATVEYLLGVRREMCGKDLAAGVDR